MTRFISLLLLVMVCLSKIYTQDIHFTGYDFSPLHLNPANTGNFNGSYRIGGIYRDQARTISPNAYSTPHFYMDANFPWGLRKNDWTSIGINFLKDKSGEIDLGHSGFVADAAYHFVMNKSGKSVLSLGGQYGSNTFSVDKNKIEFFTDLSMIQSSDKDNVQVKGNYNDISIGLAYNSILSAKKHLLLIGLSASHLNKPQFRVFSASGASGLNKLPVLISLHSSLQYNLKEKLDITPMVYVRSISGTSKAQEIAIQAKLGYLYNIPKEIKLNAGLGYRLGDALQILLGMDYGKIRTQLAYDLTISSLGKTQKPFGALELGVVYVGTVVKKPNPKPKTFCPRF